MYNEINFNYKLQVENCTFKFVKYNKKNICIIIRIIYQKRISKSTFFKKLLNFVEN